MRVLRWGLSWLAATAMVVLHATCRVRVHNDPRPALREAGESYVYCVLHAHQISVAINREPGTAAMVSQSRDGALLVPGFRVLRIRPLRGSSRTDSRDRGGMAALNEMIQHVGRGLPAILAADGPRGPRNQVHKGIAVLSKKTGAAVLTVVAIPSRRWIIRGAWDRMQIPKPFCTIHGYFAPPLRPGADESVEVFRKRVEASLSDLESRHDPTEFRHAVLKSPMAPQQQLVSEP